MAPPILKLDNIFLSFGGSPLLNGAGFQLEPGDRLCLVGRNGSGKSTVLKTLFGLLKPRQGDILLDGVSVAGATQKQLLAQGIAFVPQGRNLFGQLSVFENLRCAVLWSLGYKYTFFKFLAHLDDANARAHALMQMIKLDKKHDVLAMNLTYAEQRALEIGITIGGGANVILLDEPTAGMSRSETTRFIHLIKEVTEGRTLLTVEHDMGVVFGLADKIAVVVYGEVIAFDTPDKVRANVRVQEAYLGSAVADAQAGGH